MARRLSGIPLGLGGDDVIGVWPARTSSTAGRDALLGGAGDDFVEARDGEPDRVMCGPGGDAAGLDAQDRVAPGCETLHSG